MRRRKKKNKKKIRKRRHSLNQSSSDFNSKHEWKVTSFESKWKETPSACKSGWNTHCGHTEPFLKNKTNREAGHHQILSPLNTGWPFCSAEKPANVPRTVDRLLIRKRLTCTGRGPENHPSHGATVAWNGSLVLPDEVTADIASLCREESGNSRWMRIENRVYSCSSPRKLTIILCRWAQRNSGYTVSQKYTGILMKNWKSFQKEKLPWFLKKQKHNKWYERLEEEIFCLSVTGIFIGLTTSRRT